MLDGVDTRDPEGGTAWTFFNYNIIDEVQVGGLGQPAEYGGFTGAVVNTITKSGGNRFSHPVRRDRYTNKSLASNNTSAEHRSRRTRAVATRRAATKLNDYTVQLGGPLKKDKMFFFVSVPALPDQDRTQTAATDPRQKSARGSTCKFTFQPTPNDNIDRVAAVRQLQPEGPDRAGARRTRSATTTRRSTRTRPSTSGTRSTARSSARRRSSRRSSPGYWGYYDLNPVDLAPTHYDGETGAYSGGARLRGPVRPGPQPGERRRSRSTRRRPARTTSSSAWKSSAATIRDRFAYVEEGRRSSTTTAVRRTSRTATAYDLQGKNKRESFYAQDQWKIGRLTLNLGRPCRQHPRRGQDDGREAVLDVLGRPAPRLRPGTSPARALRAQGVLRADVRRRDLPVVEPRGAGPDAQLRLPRRSNWETLTVDSATKREYAVSDDLKHPRVDEFNVAYEQQIGRKFKLTVTGIKKDYKNFVNSVLPGAMWTPYAYTNPMTKQPMTLYKWTNPSDFPAASISEHRHGKLQPRERRGGHES